MLPRLLERGGASDSGGSITAFYTVLVEGDDLNDPVADSVRAILDGHIVLARNLVNRARLPAIDVLVSVSRPIPDLARRARTWRPSSRRCGLLSVYQSSKDLIDVGAYRAGVNPEPRSCAIRVIPDLEKFLVQGPREPAKREAAMRQLRGILSKKAT
ncbi:MAG: hypothetical protein MZV65_40735 [Chromatiales bacterium]|nr:hypothetical protein [Chromatiales bacterium]